MRTETFDQAFDKGDDVSKYLNFSKATRPGKVQKRGNVDFPVWMIQSLDKERPSGSAFPGRPSLKCGLPNG